MKGFESIIGEVDYNYDEDRNEFGSDDKQIKINAIINSEGTSILILSFNLGRKEDDSINISLDLDEFNLKIARAMIYRDDWRE